MSIPSGPPATSPDGPATPRPAGDGEDRPRRPRAGGRDLRPLSTPDEMRQCVELQEEVWGEAFSERVGVSLLKVVQRLGGVALGAFDGEGRLDGFVFGLTGWEEGRAVHWSDMLAVRSGLRDAGLGRTLKAAQRELLLARGIRTCYWTFDPLEARNAHLNLGRLGAVVREHVVDMYGASDSPLHRGIGTDRFVALWAMDSARVEARLAGREPPPEAPAGLPAAFDLDVAGGLPRPRGAWGAEGADRFLLPVPSSIQEVKARDPGLAAAWRDATREVLVAHVGRGFQVTEFFRTEGPVCHYLLERWPADGPERAKEDQP